jgi:hypothetical protein
VGRSPLVSGRASENAVQVDLQIGKERWTEWGVWTGAALLEAAGLLEDILDNRPAAGVDDPVVRDA